MKVREFIDKYLSPCLDNIIYLHSPDDDYRTIFTIRGWRTGNTDEPINEPDLEWEVAYIRAQVENYNYNLAVIIHIYTYYL